MLDRYGGQCRGSRNRSDLQVLGPMESTLCLIIATLDVTERRQLRFILLASCKEFQLLQLEIDLLEFVLCSSKIGLTDVDGGCWADGECACCYSWCFRFD